MKTLLITCFALLSFNSSLFSQGAMLTYDARSDANETNQYLLSLKGFAEASSQSRILRDSYDFYKKAQELLKKVNSAVSSYYAIQNIVKTQIATVKQYSYYYTQAKQFKHVSAESITSFTDFLNELNNSIYNLMKFSESILINDKFTMNDAERLTKLNEIESQMSEKKSMMRINFKKLQMENDALELENVK